MSHEQKINLGRLNAFLDSNAGIDFCKADLRQASSDDKYRWAGFEDEKENLIKHLRVYQHLLSIVPNGRNDLAKKLLEHHILSPAQIAHTSKDVFVQNTLTLFDGDSALAEQVYTRAALLISKVASLQQSRTQQSEPPADTVSINLEKLNAFLEKNQEIDFRAADLLHTPTVDQYNWVGLEDEKKSLLNQLKAYQRMLRVVPQDRQYLARKLLEHGIQSSLQIASIPKNAFIQDNFDLFDQDRAIAEQIYMRALTLRKAVALQYIAYVQQSESHIRTTIFVR